MLSLLNQFSSNISCHFLTKKDKVDVPQPRVRLHQVHGSRTIVARQPSESVEQADGVITDVVGLNLMARAADCQNFAVYAPEKNIIGVMHVGWKGVVVGTIPEFFRTLKKEFDVDAEEAFVSAGPSLCLKCAEYKDANFELRQKIDLRFVHDSHVDLQGAATMQLLDAGVPRDHFERHPDCTCCTPKEYWTYRGGDREAVQEGNANVLEMRLL